MSDIKLDYALIEEEAEKVRKISESIEESEKRIKSIVNNMGYYWTGEAYEAFEMNFIYNVEPQIRNMAELSEEMSLLLTKIALNMKIEDLKLSKNIALGVAAGIAAATHSVKP